MDGESPFARSRIPGFSQARLKRVVAIGNAIALALGLWTIFAPSLLYAVALALCFLLPIAAIGVDVRARGALSFEARRGLRSPRSIATILVVPSFALAARALGDLNFESRGLLLGETLTATAAAVALFYLRDARLRSDWRQLLTVSIFALPYAFGVIAYGDVVLDPSSGHDTATVIRAKRVHVSGGVHGSSVWRQVSVDARVSPGGAEWIDVRPDLFDALARGDAVCVHEGNGLLAVPWYAIRVCAGTGNQRARYGSLAPILRTRTELNETAFFFAELDEQASRKP